MVSGLKLSNSAMEAFWKCPEAYRLRYVEGLDLAITPDYFVFGHRFHQMLEAHYKANYTGAGLGVIPAAPNIKPEIELECKAMLEAYKSHYPREEFTCVDFEKYFEIQTEDTGYTYIGKIDMLVRGRDSKLTVFETKTESRSSKRNLPQAWTARHQASLYLWAASKVYNESIDSIILNICTKGSPGKQIGPTFRRDRLHRTPAQVEEALQSAKYVSTSVESLQNEMAFPRNTQNCVNERGFQCEYFAKCHMGSDEGLSQIEPFQYLTL